MDRLTYWCDDGVGGGEWRVNARGNEFAGEAVDRLAAYENTGLEPEWVKELDKAEQDGRLVVLPCKVGDVWFEKCSGRVVEIDGFKYDSYVGWAVLYHYDGWQERACNPTYFRGHFTQDEAEAALKGETDNA